MVSFRLSMTSQLIKTDYFREICEHILAHKLLDEVKAAYLLGAYLEKCKGLMEDWAEFCSSK